MISSADELIDALGGTGAVATLLGVQDNTVSTWRIRGLPGWTCAKLRDAANLASLNYAPSLFEIKPPRPVRGLDAAPTDSEAARGEAA